MASILFDGTSMNCAVKQLPIHQRRKVHSYHGQLRPLLIPMVLQQSMVKVDRTIYRKYSCRQFFGIFRSDDVILKLLAFL